MDVFLCCCQVIVTQHVLDFHQWYILRSQDRGKKMPDPMKTKMFNSRFVAYLFQPVLAVEVRDKAFAINIAEDKRMLSGYPLVF